MTKGILWDKIFHPDLSDEARKSLIAKIQAGLNTAQGREMLAALDQICTPVVFPMDKLSDPNSVGALIAQEAERNFIAQLKRLAIYNDRTDTRSPSRTSQARRGS